MIFQFSPHEIPKRESASPKYEERIAGLLGERLKEMGIEYEELRGRSDLLSLLRGSDDIGKADDERE